jgi:hypothetical protein
MKKIIFYALLFIFLSACSHTEKIKPIAIKIEPLTIDEEYEKRLDLLSFIELTDNKIKYDNIVIDFKNSLMWEDHKDNLEKKYSFKNAKAYCKNLDLYGYKDWYLPSIIELKSIVDTNRSPSILDVFEHIRPSYYWSSTINKNATQKAYYIYFKAGYEGSRSIKHKNNIRCVRQEESKHLFFSKENAMVYMASQYAKNNNIENKTFIIDYKIGLLDDFIYTHTKELESKIDKVTNILTYLYLPMVKKENFEPISLIKEEFETSEMFEVRIEAVLKEEKKRYNNYKINYPKKVRKRKKIAKDINLPLKIKLFKVASIKAHLGTFTLKKKSYNSENETMYMTVHTSRSNYNQAISLYVPQNEAKEFTENIDNFVIEPRFDLNEKTFTISTIKVSYKNKVYIGVPNNKKYSSKEIKVLLKMKNKVY